MRKRIKRNDERCGVTVKIGEKGQIIIPKQMRDMFGLNPGDTIVVLADPARGIAIPPKRTFADWIGKMIAEGTLDPAAINEADKKEANSK